jgi:hypothetical protein
MKLADMPLARLCDIQRFVTEAEITLRAEGYRTKKEWSEKPEPKDFNNSNSGTASSSDDHPPIEVVEDAARYLGSRNDYDRDAWIRIGLAMKASGENFRQIWEDFCLNYPDNNLREAAKRWNSFRPKGKVGPGTLLHMAKEKGWACPEHLRSNGGGVSELGIFSGKSKSGEGNNAGQTNDAGNAGAQAEDKPAAVLVAAPWKWVNLKACRRANFSTERTMSGSFCRLGLALLAAASPPSAWSRPSPWRVESRCSGSRRSRG